MNDEQVFELKINKLYYILSLISLKVKISYTGYLKSYTGYKYFLLFSNSPSLNIVTLLYIYIHTSLRVYTCIERYVLFHIYTHAVTAVYIHTGWPRFANYFK